MNNYGYMGTVVESTRQQVKIKIKSETDPNLSEEKKRLMRVAPPYISGNKMAKKLGVTPLLLSRITGTIFVQTSDQTKSDLENWKLNIGLNLKFNKRNEEVCGYSRKDAITGYWLYSSKTQDEIKDYMRDYRDVIDYLIDINAQDVNAKDLFPENTVEKIEELQKWLKNRGSAHAERQTCSTQILEKEVVFALETYIDNFLKVEMKPKTINLNVKPSSLYLPKPKLGQAPDLRAHHWLFDRVINVRESHTVPLGAKGTIIGIHDEDKGPKAMYDVLFDKPFTGGLSIRCSAHRGYRLPVQAFINITYGQKCDVNITHIGKPTTVVEPSADGSPTHQRRGRRHTYDNQPRETKAPGKNKQSQLFNKASPNTKGQLHNASDNSMGSMENENSSVYTMQLLSLHEKKGRIPIYLYKDTTEGKIICTVLCYNGKEYEGPPEFTNDMASESAARIALQCLAKEDHQASPSAPFHSGKRSTPFMTTPQRHPFGPTMRLPEASNSNWREPVHPSNLPPPPTNSYQKPRVTDFLPEWTFRGANPEWSGNIVQPPQQNLFTPPSQFQHHNKYLPPQNQFDHQNQFGQLEPFELTGPEDVLKPYDVIPTQELPPVNLKTSADDPLMNLIVRVGEVKTPCLFYVILDSKYNELQSMMDDLHNFYQQEEHNYKIKLPYVSERLVCACKYEGLWHRAVITAIRRNHTVDIEYIDFGTPGNVHISELRFLQNDFAKLPAQAICAKLIGLVPKSENRKWSNESCCVFLSLVTERRVTAYVYRINTKKNKEERILLEVILFDTNDKEEIVLNEYLVEKGFAEFINHVQGDKEEEITVNETVPAINIPQQSPAVNRLLHLSHTLKQYIFQVYILPETSENTKKTASVSLKDELCLKFPKNCPKLHLNSTLSNSESTEHRPSLLSESTNLNHSDSTVKNIGLDASAIKRGIRKAKLKQLFG